MFRDSRPLNPSIVLIGCCCLFNTTHCFSLLEQGTHRLLTWNIFGPAYAGNDSEFLDWSYRSQLIVDILWQANADILCLQEVPTDENDRQALLGPLEQKYTAILQQVTPGHPVCCATLVRTGLFDVVLEESRSRALWIVLQDLSSMSNSEFIVANIHLMAGVDQEATRFCQVRSLLKHCSKVNVNNLLIAGDCNMLPGFNPVHIWLSTGTWDNGVAKAFFPASEWSQIAQQADRCRLQALQWIDSSYLERTYTMGSTLDSIWVSSSMLSRPWPVLPPPLDGSTQWPSADHPSDHWMLGVEFSLQR